MANAPQPDDVDGATTDLPRLLSADERLAALDGEHIGRKARTYRVGQYLACREDGGKIQILGGEHGCQVRYVYAWYQQRWNFSWTMADRVDKMNDHFKAMLQTDQPSRFDKDKAWGKVEDLNEWMDENGVDHWNEQGIIGIGPGDLEDENNQT